MKKWMLLLWLVGFLACNTEQKQSAAVQDEIKMETGLTLEPMLANADSVQFLYFTNPFGDSLRYTRYYTYHNSGDTALIRTLKNQMDTSFQVQPAPRTCRSNGKMFFYSKGKEAKTVYFATQGNGCSYLYYIKNGLFYYFTINTSAENLLKALKEKTIEP